MSNSNDIQEMKDLLRGFTEVNKLIVWRDLLVYAIFGWGLIAYTIYSFNIITFIIGSFLLYKGTMLIHEVSHIAKKVPGYRLVYNLLLGWPNSYPAYIFDTHLFHHGKKTYGTIRDPEYHFIKKFDVKMLLKPIIASALLPFIQWFRFGLISLITPFMPYKFKKHLYQKYSSLVFSIRYTRPIRNEKKEINSMMIQDLICASYKVALIALVAYDIIPFVTIPTIYGAIVLASILNMYRALFNHIYANEQEVPLSWEDHLLDTATIEPGILTSLFFVNGLNYHAIHHLFPEMPYHHLKKAHHILIKEVGNQHIYKRNLYSDPINLLKFCIKGDRLGKLSINAKTAV